MIFAAKFEYVVFAIGVDFLDFFVDTEVALTGFFVIGINN